MKYFQESFKSLTGRQGLWKILLPEITSSENISPKSRGPYSHERGQYHQSLHCCLLSEPVPWLPLCMHPPLLCFHAFFDMLQKIVAIHSIFIHFSCLSHVVLDLEKCDHFILFLVSTISRRKKELVFPSKLRKVQTVSGVCCLYVVCFSSMGYHQSQQLPVTMKTAFSVDKLQFYLCLARAFSSLPTQNRCLIYHWRANMFLCMSVAYKQLLPQPGHSSILLRKESSASNNLSCRFFFSNKIFFCFARSDTWGYSGHKMPETVYFGKQGHPWWEVLLATTKSGVLNQTEAWAKGSFTQPY